MQEMTGYSGNKDCTKKNYYRYSSFLWMIIISATLSAAATVIAFFPARVKAQPAQTTTQMYTPARFVLELAEVSVTMQQPSGNNTQKLLFKLNTATGEVWALQLATISITNPQILSAGWVKVSSTLPIPNINQQL